MKTNSELTLFLKLSLKIPMNKLTKTLILGLSKVVILSSITVNSN